MVTALNFPIQENIYNYPNRFMVPWWGTDSYFNNDHIQIGDIEIMTAAYGSSWSFGSILISKSIGHKKNIFRISNFVSKQTPIHGPVHKYDFNCLYSRSNFSRLQQAVAKILILFVSES